MKSLTDTQKQALAFFKPGEPRTAYRTGSLATLRAMVRKGWLRDVTKPGPGSLLTPATHFEFELTNDAAAHLFPSKENQNAKA